MFFFVSTIGSHLRLFASANNNNGRKSVKDGTVNRSNSRAKQLIRENEPPLTIYPYSFDELRKSQSKTKSTDKTEKNTNKTKKTTKIAIPNTNNHENTQKSMEIANKTQDIVMKLILS